MAVQVKIPTPLQKLTDGKEDVQCSAGTITSVIEELEAKHPGMLERLTEGGKVRRFINIYVNGEDMRFMDLEQTAVNDGSEVSIVPAVAGG